MSNIKLERIASQIVRELSSIFYEEVHNEILKNVTIIDARVTNDLSLAKVYYTFLGDYDKVTIAAELKNASSFLRTELAKRMDLRTTPELRFVYDESTEYGEHIDEIIEEIHNENK
ncbi:MAG: 30S ribosome-binding factor RbfA [Bacilli bacterium]|nr:30S ribosome-binding factor RbfA [bacterium]MDY3757034.1 30S ribosome-binding factor RbfA [Bacilli bacterium]